MTVPTDEQIKAFTDAINAALNSLRLPSQADEGRHLGMAQQSISNYRRGRVHEPDPDKIFELEAGLELAPGTLSRHLGWVPVDACSDTPVDVVSAVVAAVDLDDHAKELLIGTYRRLSDPTQ